MLATARFIVTEGLMIIAFDSTELRAICEDPSSTDAHMGKDRAEAFRDRLADIRAAVTYEDLIVGNPRIGGESGGELRVDIGPRGTLVLKANHRHLPWGKDGEVDWSRVSYVRLVEVDLL